MVRDQVSMEGVAKGDLLFCQLHLGQAQSDVQGRCRVAYDELNCVGGEGSAYSDTYLQSLLLE
jgi:hypothetical protein